jgi:hypothetical protein
MHTFGARGDAPQRPASSTSRTLPLLARDDDAAGGSGLSLPDGLSDLRFPEVVLSYVGQHIITAFVACSARSNPAIFMRASEPPGLAE